MSEEATGGASAGVESRHGLDLLIDVADLEARLKYALSPEERKVAAEVIWDASNLARHHGRPGWTALNVPPVVKTVVRNACVRYMEMDSVTLSRAGDETEQYSDLGDRTATVFFNAEERSTIKAAAGSLSGSFQQVSTYVHDPSVGVRPEPHARLRYDTVRDMHPLVRWAAGL